MALITAISNKRSKYPTSDSPSHAHLTHRVPGRKMSRGEEPIGGRDATPRLPLPHHHDVQHAKESHNATCTAEVRVRWQRGDRRMREEPMNANTGIGHGDDRHAAKRILLVDDDTAIQDSLSALLSDEGYEVRASRDGKDALDILRAS